MIRKILFHLLVICVLSAFAQDSSSAEVSLQVPAVLDTETSTVPPVAESSSTQVTDASASSTEATDVPVESTTTPTPQAATESPQAPPPIESSEDKESPKEDVIGVTICSESSTCESIANSQCKEGICQCADLYVPNLTGKACLKIADNIGDECEITKQCEALNATCSESKCAPRQEEEKQYLKKTSSALEKSPQDVGGSASAISAVVFLQFFSLVVYFLS